MSGTEVVVGRIGRPHGVKGEVSVELRSDEPERRFTVGAVLSTRSAVSQAAPAERPRTLTVRARRWHHSRLLVTFAELADRDAAEAVRGLLLEVEVDPAESPEDPEEYYDHQLVGLRMVTTGGREVGEVVEVLHSPAQDLLSVRGDEGLEILVPFVARFVPEVDLPGGRILVEDVPGLVSPAAEDEEGGA